MAGSGTITGITEVVLREVHATGGVPRAVAVAGDADGELSRELLSAGAERIRLFVDSGAPTNLPSGVVAVELAELSCANTELVVGVLPKSLDALAELAETVALTSPRARLILGARQQHLVRSMNEVLAASFASVRASLGHRKSRALVAQNPRPDAHSTFPRFGDVPEWNLAVRAFGGVFASATLDIGTRVLLETLAISASRVGGVAAPACIVDLGCGTGLLASWAAMQWPSARVIATDRSSAAVRSAAATAAANGVRVETVRADAGSELADGIADLVLLNPPFHDGRTLDAGMANRLFVAASRILRPGGKLLCVFNSHLRHREHLERLVGQTRQLARTPKFTVTVSVRA